MISGIDLKKINERLGLSPVTLIFTVLSIVIILIFILFLITPRQKSIEKIRQEIQSTSTEIKVLKEKFIPAYVQAKNFEQIKFDPQFLLPKREHLDRKKLPGLPDQFNSLALKQNLKLSNKDLDLAFLKNKTKSVSIFLELEGRLQDFRNYLIVIISLPFFDSFEKIKIDSTQNNIKKFSVDLKINIE
jgi:Tfp pilus assembly protein PilO